VPKEETFMLASAQSRMRTLSFAAASSADPVLARLRQGDARALGEVYDQHHEAVRAFAQRLVGDEAAAEDLVHEVFVALPRALGRFEGQSSLRSFLIGIAINHARHFTRSAARRRAMLTRYEQQPQAASPESPEQAFERGRWLDQLHRALDGLSLEHRVAFVLCDVEERTASEAARITGAPEATMRTRLFHARKKLRAALESMGVV
jgi:RNA polymerase sigma-70 factor, ECF subfamily